MRSPNLMFFCLETLCSTLLVLLPSLKHSTGLSHLFEIHMKQLRESFHSAELVAVGKYGKNTSSTLGTA